VKTLDRAGGGDPAVTAREAVTAGRLWWYSDSQSSAEQVDRSNCFISIRLTSDSTSAVIKGHQALTGDRFGVFPGNNEAA
jgi:hypothetical protein